MDTSRKDGVSYVLLHVEESNLIVWVHVGMTVCRVPKVGHCNLCFGINGKNGSGAYLLHYFMQDHQTWFVGHLGKVCRVPKVGHCNLYVDIWPQLRNNHFAGHIYRRRCVLRVSSTFKSLPIIKSTQSETLGNYTTFLCTVIFASHLPKA